MVPDLRVGRTVLIAAHGNSLRALVKHLDGISDEDIAALNIPTGIPLRYDIDPVTLRPVTPGGECPRPGGGEGSRRGGREPGPLRFRRRFGDLSRVTLGLMLLFTSR